MKRLSYLSLMLIAAIFTSCKKDNSTPNSTQTTNSGYASGDIYTVSGNGYNAASKGGYSGDGGEATSAELGWSFGVVIDNSGNIYISDTWNHRIRKVTPTGIITTIAGNGTNGGSGDGGPATAAELSLPYDLAIDHSNNLYFADGDDCVVRMVNTIGYIYAIAGNGNYGYSGDGGPATAGELADPTGVAVDASGNVYIGDAVNCCVRKVNTNGIISTFAGNGSIGFYGDGGIATAAELREPTGVSADTSGNVYIADQGNQRIRVVNTSNIISTIAGNGYAFGGYSGDGAAATAAELNEPQEAIVDGKGNIYIADQINNCIRIINASGVISTFAGNTKQGYYGDGGPAISAEMNYPSSIAIDLSGNLYIADQNNSRVRIVYK